MRNKGKKYRITALILVLMISFISVIPGSVGTVQAASKTPMAAHGRLSVKGADLVDGKKRKFQLRGISTHGINWDVGYPYVNKGGIPDTER